MRAIEAAVASKNAQASALPPNEENQIPGVPQPAESAIKDLDAGKRQVAAHSETGSESEADDDDDDDDSDDDIVGPTLPGMQSSGRKAGAKFPTLEELEEQKGNTSYINLSLLHLCLFVFLALF